MHFPAFCLALVLLTYFGALGSDVHHSRENHANRCATSVTSKILSKEVQFQALSSQAGSWASDLTTKKTAIDLHFHVLAASEQLIDGYIPDSQILEQIAVLNHAYRFSPLSFSLVNITRTIHYEWFNYALQGNYENEDMKRELRFGDVKTLNVYSVGFNIKPYGILGYATFPSGYEEDPLNDGVVIHYASLPGGSYVPFDLGYTLVHEVGHWVGVYHTFQGGCDDPDGDFVADTPTQAYASLGCPIGADTCESPGLDPIHNFMDYSDDACMNQFTRGQIIRMRQQLALYRDIRT